MWERPHGDRTLDGTQNCVLTSHHTQASTVLGILSLKDTQARLCGGRSPRQTRTTRPPPPLTLLGGDAGVLLTLCPPVGHGLEAAGAYGVASLQGAHIILGCRTDRMFKAGCRDTGRGSRSENVYWGGYKVHTRTDRPTRTPREKSDLFSTATDSLPLKQRSLNRLKTTKISEIMKVFCHFL